MTERSTVPRWAVFIVAAALSVPLIVATVQMKTPTWSPVLDLAMTELRVRDVGTEDTPLIGLPGRIGESLEEQGSHPGPLSFYALTPSYRALGSSSWALQVGAALVHIVAIAVALVLARRRGGPAVFAAVAVALAVLIAGFGSGALTEPWNPYLPLLWWVVVLLGVWSVLDGDLVALPVVVLAGSFCAQTHVPYLSLSIGVGVTAALWVAHGAVRSPSGSPDRASATRSLAVAGVLGVLLWIPPTVDEFTQEPGNYTKLVDHFTTPPDGEEPIGFAAGADEALARLDLWHLGSHALTDPALLTNTSLERSPSSLRGVVVLLFWAVSAMVALLPAYRDRRLLTLHATVAGALVFGYVSITRIFGLTWYYLMLWMWAAAALLAMSTAWTLWRVVARTDIAPVSTGRLAAGLALVAALVTAHTTAADAVDAEQSDAEISSVLADLVPDTVAALDAGVGPSTGRSGRYHVTWRDSLHIGSQAFGLLNELDRAGFDAGLAPLFHVPATDQRVIDSPDSTAQVVVVNGAFVDQYRERTDAVEVAFADPRDRADVERFDGLRADLLVVLERRGLTDLIVAVDENLFAVAIDPRLPEPDRRKADEMLAIGAPTAVFLLPPGAPG